MLRIEIPWYFWAGLITFFVLLVVIVCWLLRPRESVKCPGCGSGSVRCAGSDMRGGRGFLFSYRCRRCGADFRVDKAAVFR